jgi:hypothetical protein
VGTFPPDAQLSPSRENRLRGDRAVGCLSVFAWSYPALWSKFRTTEESLVVLGVMSKDICPANMHVPPAH